MGVFTNALSFVARQRETAPRAIPSRFGGLAVRLLSRFQLRAGEPPRLSLVERINLAPRQTLALIEADGQRVLVATSAEGAAAFYPLPPKPNRTSRSRKTVAEGKFA